NKSFAFLKLAKNARRTERFVGQKKAASPKACPNDVVRRAIIRAFVAKKNQGAKNKSGSPVVAAAFKIQHLRSADLRPFSYHISSKRRFRGRRILA
ncbi:MAG: hypothetical protein LC670_14135, partial [Flavobacteriales bacterium]|nr:hypothetical protein [Flavobacteriales bacterium]